MRRLCLALLASALAACTALPDEGPSTSGIVDAAAQNDPAFPYAVVNLTAGVAATVSHYYAEQLPAAPQALPPPRPVGNVGAGDTLRVTLWEPGQDGRLAAGPDATIDVTTAIDRDGTISIPYAGRLAVAGKTPGEIEAAIRTALRGRAVEPQITVLVTQNNSNSVIVQGDVAKPGRYPLQPAGHALLDLVALAGGPRVPGAGNIARVTRDGHSATIGLARAIEDPAENVVLAPGDTILIVSRPRRFYAFGAVDRPGEQVFPERRMVLAQGLGHLAGLRDDRADPSGIFIFRYEPAALARQLPAASVATDKPETPIVYRLNLRNPTAFFVLDAFPLRPRDLVYVADAPISEFGKFAQIISGFSNTAAAPRNFGAVD